jgi:tetratricopeptide (TPR) repeat protein
MAKNWNAEIENYKKETETDPEDSNSWYNYGMANIQSVGAKIQSGNLDAECKQKIPVAESALKKAIELYPQHGRAHVLLGQLYRYTKQYDDSIKYAKKGLELPPDTSDWFAAAETVASCYMLKEDMPHSIEYLELIKEHYPDEPMTIFKRACCYWEAGKLDAAEEEFEHLTKIPGGNPNAPSCLEQVRAKKAQLAGTSEKKKATSKGPAKAEDTSKKVQDVQAKAQELGNKLTEDIKKVMASDMPPEKKSAEVTRLQKEFNDKLTALMKN